MSHLLKLLRLALGAFLAIVIAILAIYIYLAPSLPGVAVLRDVELQVPLKVYSRDGKLIAVYGEQRREPLGVDEIPESMVQAFLAAEDDRFYEHLGVDYQGLARAALHVLLTGEKRQGGSTVTMQLARNFFLDNERTYRRKFKEIFLALRIEHEFNKNEILELYLNKIYLGNRAYGVGAAAEVYYGRSVQDLNLAQIAMIAGLPKAPSRFNPIVNPERAVIRRNYVLGRMHKLEFIDDYTYREMLETPVSASMHYPRVEMSAPYIGEMARAQMVEEYGSEAYTKGYRVYTTINSTLQREAQLALRNGLHAYDRRHGWRGAEGHLELEYTEEDPGQIAYETLDEAILDMELTGGLMPAVVTRVEPGEIEAYLGEQQFAVLSIEQARWARSYLGVNSMGATPKDFTAMLAPGDVIRITRKDTGEWTLSQVPEAAGAFVAIDPQNGSVLALVGGYDYLHSKFNRAAQAKRPARLEFQTVYLFRGARIGLHSGQHRQRCAGGARRQRPGKRLAPEELQRQVFRSHPPSRGPGEVPQHGLHPGAAKRGPPLHRGAYHQLRVWPGANARGPVPGAGFRCGDAAGDGPRLRGVRQWRLLRGTVRDRKDRGRAGRGPVPLQSPDGLRGGLPGFATAVVPQWRGDPRGGRYSGPGHPGRRARVVQRECLPDGEHDA